MVVATTTASEVVTEQLPYVQERVLVYRGGGGGIVSFVLRLTSRGGGCNEDDDDVNDVLAELCC